MCPACFAPKKMPCKVISVVVSLFRQPFPAEREFVRISRFRAPLVAAVLFYCSAVSSISWAQPLSTWIGGSGSWGSSDDWVSSIAPGATTDVVFDAALNGGGGTIVMNAGGGTREASSITFAADSGSYFFVQNGTGSPKTLYIGAGGITNNGTATQTFSGQLTLTDSQTWMAAEGNIVTERLIDLQQNRLTFKGSSDAIINTEITGGGEVVKSGSGTLFVNVTPTYTGVTLLEAGTLQYGANVPNGGALELRGGNLIANDQNLSFSSFRLSGFASITLGIDGVSQNLSLGSADYLSGALTIYNWSSSPTSDNIYITSQPDQDFLDSVTFDGFGPGAQWVNGIIVPIPEPASIALAVVGGVMLFFRCRRRSVRS